MPDWIEDYLDYTSPQESPELFHKWCAIATIASVLNRRIFLQRRAKTGTTFFTDYPGQVSPIIVAGSGKARKTTAIRIAQSLMKEAGVRLYDGKITPERLLTKMASLPGGNAIMTVVEDELTAFVGRQSYNDGLIENLIKLADCSGRGYETQKGQVELQNVCFTLLAGTTPYSMGKAVPPAAHSTGWLSRYIWVYSEASGRVEPLAYDEDEIDENLFFEETEKRARLIIRLRAMSQYVGGFRWGAQAGKWFRDYYAAYARSPASEGEGWPSRRPSHLARTAMILAVSRGCPTLEFTIEDLMQADRLLRDVETDMPKAFAFIGQSVNADQQERILKVFRDNKLKGKEVVSGQEIKYKTLRYFTEPRVLQSQTSLLEQAGVIQFVGRDATNDTLWKMLKEPY